MSAKTKTIEISTAETGLNRLSAQSGLSAFLDGNTRIELNPFLEAATAEGFETEKRVTLQTAGEVILGELVCMSTTTINDPEKGVHEVPTVILQLKPGARAELIAAYQVNKRISRPDLTDPITHAAVRPGIQILIRRLDDIKRPGSLRALTDYDVLVKFPAI